MFKDEITQLAKELGIKEHHIEKLLDGTYTAVWITNTEVRRDKEPYKTLRIYPRVCLAARIGKGRNPVIKSVKPEDKEAISKMIEIVRLFKLHKLESKAEERKREILS